MINYSLNFKEIWKYIDFFIEGTQFTVLLWFTSMIMSLIFGIIVSIGRRSEIKIINGIATFYIEIFRNTPLLIQLWLFYFGLGEIGIHISVLNCAVLALGLNATAYTAEITRAGFDSVDIEIIEAANSLGMKPWQVYKVAIIPIGLRAVLPTLCNMSIQILLATSILQVLGLNELTNQALRVSSKTFRSFEAFIFVAIIYIFLSFCITIIFTSVTKKINKGTLH